MMIMNIEQKIEVLREEMVDLGMKKGFQDQQVIIISRKLDELLNQYYRHEQGKAAGRVLI
ncbi:MAG TPA: aspartyl-phosphate phosphatase Spo0E family protein [Syntrophomonas sp.]|nr:aspartyl-phosphate phosphatase Spo0E family protein [Syntrophomonas sp.]